MIKERLLWAEALESGRYLQTFGMIKEKRFFEPARYCALGVAVKLNLTTQDWDIVDPFAGYTTKDIEEFIVINDVYRFSFTEIAKIVRLSIEHPNRPISELVDEYWR